MDKLDKMIKDFFEDQKSRFPGRRQRSDTSSAEEVYRYLNEELVGAELERMLDYLKGNREGQELILKARELFRSEASAVTTESVPAPWTAKAKSLMTSKAALCPHCGKALTSFRNPLSAQRRSNILWLLAAGLAFLGSIAVPRYFMQFLLVAALAGVKTLLDLRATKTQIMIYKALSEDGTESRHLHDHPSRL